MKMQALMAAMDPYREAFRLQCRRLLTEEKVLRYTSFRTEDGVQWAITADIRRS